MTREVATTSYDKTARIWDAESGKEIAVLKGHNGPVSMAIFNGDNTRVATASYDSTARIWDAESCKGNAVLKGHKGSVYTAAFGSDGKWVVTASEDNCPDWGCGEREGKCGPKRPQEYGIDRGLQPRALRQKRSTLPGVVP
jgi:WD40 repeat protein